MKRFLQFIIGKILNIELEGTSVKSKKTGENKIIDETKVNIGVELPLINISLDVKYKLNDGMVVSKMYFDMNYEVIK